jgi:hypothetical protein
MGRCSLLLLIPCVICSGGCIYTNTLAPGVTGRVLDAETGLPVAGAQIARESGGIVGFERAARVTSGTDGSFDMPPLRHTTWFDLYTRNPEFMTGVFAIGASGYSSTRLQGAASKTNRWRTSLGDIKLRRDE